ncbi:peptidyl-prolyl cis-trans isomerase FKBP43-like isoform X2 [Papaver somniferum]|uniref:peptidyl-prolyl cis-trans isomerase FKBP43-like isoform X2 n=1 Tax=Papaver somniferum TaxID=3469 RepID=UPI000E702301|nr:peptidyl-prolyl cis-trans isomerase FKBP43-like isoform X2 [Papaver somniferum]
MSFWGIEIKPGKPFVLHRHETPGKIQITQATLGMGILTKRSVVQCNISGRSPVLLCALLPDKIESLSLSHQFDEEVDVTFSVLGPRSVHLTGFYCESGSSRCGAGGDSDSDSESYGVDIAETDNESDQSSDREEEDDLDGFIVDDDTEMSPPSKGRKSAVVKIEETDGDERPASKKGKRRHLRKKYQISDSEVDEIEIGIKDHARCEISGSEDEDIVPISHLIKTKATTESKGEANSNSEIQLAKENKEGNGSSDPDIFEVLNQDSHVQVSEAEQISELPKDPSATSADIDQESNVKEKKRKKRSHGEDGETKIEQDHDRVELKPKEEQPSAIPSKDSSVPSADIVLESDVKPKKKSKRNRGEDGAKAKNMDQDCAGVKPKEGQPSDSGIRLESDVTPKKKHRRNRGEDGDAKTKTMDLDLAGVELEKEQLTDMVCGEDVNAKNGKLDQDPVEIKTRKNQANDKIINSAGHVSNQDNGEVKKKKKKKKAQKNVCDEEDKK